MPGGVPWLSVAHFATGLGALGLLWQTRSIRDRAGTALWAAILVLIAASTLVYGVALLTHDVLLRSLLEALTLSGIVWTGFFYCTFALAFTGRAHVFRTYWFRGLVALHGVATVIVLSNPTHHLVLSAFDVESTRGAAVGVATKEPLLFGFAGVVYLTVGAGVAMLVETVSGWGSAYRQQALAMAVSPVFAIAASLVWLFELGPYPHLNLIPLGLLPAVFIDYYALFGREMFDLPPGLRRAGEKSALDDLGSPVFILADDGRIIDMNSAAEDTFGLPRDLALAESISDLLGTDVDLRAGEQRISQLVDGERLTFKLVLSTFETKSGPHRGFTVIMQDVTTEMQRKQRLEVLNRILRHNLRNDLNVVKLHAQQLDLALSDPDELDHVAEIEAVSTDLVDLGEKARWASQALEDATPREVGLGRLLESVATDLEERYERAEITVEAAADLRVVSDPAVLELVFASVIENGIEHTEREGASVAVVAKRDGDASDSVRVRVRDDGPGIPDHERRVIAHGEETALAHGSGIGLWLVHWGVRMLGGDVDFEVDDDGTTVSIRLPAETE
jgi:signal transduction histidine kinase